MGNFDKYRPDSDQFEVGYSIGVAVSAALYKRLELRRQERLREVLVALYGSSVGRFCCLTGSAALHGVYLRKRPAKDIDLRVPTLIRDRFLAIMEQVGLEVESKGDGRSYFYRGEDYGMSLSTARSTVAIELYDNSLGTPVVRGTYLDVRFGTVDVFCRPLCDLLLCKIANLYSRTVVVDYIDLWLGLREHPTIIGEIVDKVRNDVWRYGLATPSWPIILNRLINPIDSLKDVWEVNCAKYLIPLPALDSLRDELRQMLGPLDGLRPLIRDEDRVDW